MAAAIRSVPVTNGIIVDVSDTVGVVDYRGYTLRATTTGIINIRQGNSTGLILDTLSLTAPASAVTVVYEPGIRCEGDLYCEIVSGVWVGSIRHG